MSLLKKLIVALYVFTVFWITFVVLLNVFAWATGAILISATVVDLLFMVSFFFGFVVVDNYREVIEAEVEKFFSAFVTKE